MSEWNSLRWYKTRARYLGTCEPTEGYLWLQKYPEPALVFRSRTFFRRPLELQIPIGKIATESSWSLVMTDGTTENFLLDNDTDIRRVFDELFGNSTTKHGKREKSRSSAADGLLERKSVTSTPQLPGFKHINALGFSTALMRFAQAVRDSHTGYGLTVEGEVFSWGTQSAVVSDSQQGIYEPVRMLSMRLKIPSKVVQLVGTRGHIVALDENGRVWAWGNDYFEAIGRTDRSPDYPLVISPLSNVAFLLSTQTTKFAVDVYGNVWSWGGAHPSRLGDGTESNPFEPVRIQGLENVVELESSVDGSRIFALDRAGAVWAWGNKRNNYEECSPATPTRITSLPPVKALGEGSSAIDHDGRVWVVGKELEAVLVRGLADIVEVMCVQCAPFSEELTFHAVDAQGFVYGWGLNLLGQIGDGTTMDRKDPVKLPGLERVTALQSIGWLVYALTSEGGTYAWGGHANERTRATNIRSSYGPAPRFLSFPQFTECPDTFFRWASLDLVSPGSRELRSQFLDLRNGRTPMMLCAGMGIVNEVALMLTQGGNIDATDADGDTALLYAASKGHLEVVDMLLRAGADPNYHRKSGGNSTLANSAIMGLTNGMQPRGTHSRNYQAVTLLLLKAGADPADMYSRRIKLMRYTENGTTLIIEQEHLYRYLNCDDLVLVFDNR